MSIFNQTQTAWTDRVARNKFREFGERYFNDPCGFVLDCIVWRKGKDERPAPYQLEIMRALVDYQRACVRGPHGLGKSALSAWTVWWFALTREALGYDWKIPTTASAWRQLTHYLWPEIVKWSRRLDWAKDEMILTVDTDQGRILRNIMKLYTQGRPFDCDATYSKGVFYKHVAQPVRKFDLWPAVPGVEQADARHLPLADASIESIVFDPPFKASHSKVKGIIEQRFTAFPSMLHLWDFYHDALAEFYRVLKPRGIVVFKCQDGVSSGINHNSHYHVENSAHALGFAYLDMFVLLARSVLWSPNVRGNQKHARKTHSFVYVFQKPKFA